MEEYKDERIPSKRFEVATDPQAKSRLDDFREGIISFQQKHPELLGATVFGSMIKGDKATPKSDVDAFLYVDAEKLSEEERQKDFIALGREYRKKFLEDLEISKEESEEYYGDLIPKLLSPEVIQHNIAENIRYEKEMNLIRKKRIETDASNLSEEEKSQLYSEEPRSVIDNFEIGGMFHARVGSGIEKYRHIFLEQLYTLPDQDMAEKIWMGVYAQISTMEGGYDKKRILPETLLDGIKIYHPELYNMISEQKRKEEIKKIESKLQDLS